MWKQRGFFDHRNYIEKSRWKQRGFSDHRNYIEKRTWKQRGFFDHRNYIEKRTWKQRGFLDRKRYVEMSWKFVEIWFSTYRRNIDVESTWIRRGVTFGTTFVWLHFGCCFSDLISCERYRHSCRRYDCSWLVIFIERLLKMCPQ